MNSPTVVLLESPVVDAPYLLDWHHSADPICQEYIGERHLMLLEVPVSDLGARIVAGALADMFDHLWMTLHTSAVASEYEHVLLAYDDTAIGLREMAHGEDDAAFIEADAAYENRPARRQI